jgi:hypothetical protein
MKELFINLLKLGKFLVLKLQAPGDSGREKLTNGAGINQPNSGMKKMDNDITSDLTFITNEKSRKLLDRFVVLIKDTALFDALAGYFYTSGFHSLYRSLESTEKIRFFFPRSQKELPRKAQRHRGTEAQSIEGVGFGL